MVESEIAHLAKHSLFVVTLGRNSQHESAGSSIIAVSFHLDDDHIRSLL
jgi:hypothetical protein